MQLKLLLLMALFFISEFDTLDSTLSNNSSMINLDVLKHT